MPLTPAPPGYLIFEASSSVGTATIHLEGVTAEATDFFRRTLKEMGTLLILFGGIEDGSLVLLNPEDYHFQRTSAIIDGEIVYGEGGDNWQSIRRRLVDSFPTRRWDVSTS